MQYTTLGKTGLQVSVAGLGCGGNSRLGQADGKSEAHSVAIVRSALDLGVNFLDTAAAYGTEAIVGKALRDVPREAVVISTKALIEAGGELRPADQVVASLESSLRALGTDHVDIFHLHAVPPELYERARETLVPPLLAERARGKLRATSASPRPGRVTPGTGCWHARCTTRYGRWRCSPSTC